jgi:hypothetical protein
MEEQKMKTNIQKKVIIPVLSFLTILVFALTACQKEQQLAQPAQADLALRSNLLSSDLSSRILLVSGGGQGTFGTDLDGDGDIDGSHFGMGVSIFGNNVANGHFECNMAGNADILGLPLMAVEGKVANGSVNADGSVIFSGVATVNLGKGVIFKDVPFSVTVTWGGPGVGTLTLTVIGAFDGVPGDTNVGNGNYDLPTETVASGQIKIHP